jgi:hypothetical protein
VLGAVLASAAVDVPWSRQIDGDAAGDAAERFAPPGNVCDGFLVHTVLQCRGKTSARPRWPSASLCAS